MIIVNVLSNKLLQELAKEAYYKSKYGAERTGLVVNVAIYCKFAYVETPEGIFLFDNNGIGSDIPAKQEDKVIINLPIITTAVSIEEVVYTESSVLVIGMKTDLLHKYKDYSCNLNDFITIEENIVSWTHRLELIVIKENE